MASVTHSTSTAEAVAVKRQPGVAETTGAAYVPPMLEHVGDQVDALLAVRLDPTQEEDDDA